MVIVRIFVAKIIADEAGKGIKIASGICYKDSLGAIDHALAAKDVGSHAVLLMPPHHWLRFGRTSECDDYNLLPVPTASDRLAKPSRFSRFKSP